MNTHFARALSLLRQEKRVSQRAAAKELGISQALLSHYENGIREPGLGFVVRACDYYAVSADFLLGRTMMRDGTMILDADTLYDYSADRDNTLHGSVMATLYKKLIVNSVGLLFDLLGKTGRKDAIRAAANMIGLVLYQIFRPLYEATPGASEDFFAVPPPVFHSGVPVAEGLCAQWEYTRALAAHVKEKGHLPPMDHDALTRDYPGMYQSILQITHTAGERINRHAEGGDP